MIDRQWTDGEWLKFEKNYSKANTDQFKKTLLDLTRGQGEHPEWYHSPCLCQSCCSYGD